MDPNTHGEVLYLGDGMLAFVDGIPDTCDHDYSDPVYQSASGKWIYWHTYRQWASLPTDARDRLIHEHHEKIDDPLVLGTTQCRKCKKIYSPPMF